MTDALKKELREKIEMEIRDVENELRSVGHVNPSNPADWEAQPDKMDILNADANEVADSIESYEENTAILKQLEIRLNELKGALASMEIGAYGVCRICKKEIEPERLRANPAATTCLLHKEAK